MECEDLVRFYQAAKTSRSRIEQDWHDIERYVLPYRGQFYNEVSDESGVERDVQQIYDATATVSLQTLASAISATVTPHGVQWFRLAFKDNSKLAQDGPASEWLENATKACWNALMDSDFGIEAEQTYVDIVGFGTNVVMEEDLSGPDGEFLGLDFTSAPLKDTFFDEDHKHQLYRFYRRLRWTPTQMVSKFGEDGVPEEILEKAENPDASRTRLEVVFCIYPVEANRDADVSKRLAVEARPYQSKYILLSTKEQLGELGGYYEMPAFAVRYARSNDSQWGNSPTMFALPDIKTLNRQEELMLLALERVIDPPMGTTERGVIGDLDMSAGAVNVLRNLDEIKPLVGGERLDVGAAEREAKRESIRSIYHVDKLRLKESPAMTATEVQVRYQLMQQHLASMMALVQADFLKPVVTRTFHVLMRRGVIPRPPESVRQAGAEYEVEYRGPMARSQKQDEVANINNYVGTLVELAGAAQRPDLLDHIDFDALPRITGELLAVPPTLIKDETQVAAKREQDAAAAQAQRDLLMAEQTGNAMNAIGEGAGKMKEAGQTLQ